MRLSFEKTVVEFMQNYARIKDNPYLAFPLNKEKELASMVGK